MSEIENPTAEETEVTDETSADGTDAETTEGTDALGDAGKKALDSMKSKWRGERDKRRDLEQRIAELETASKPTEGEPSVDEIRKQAASEAMSKANTRILRSEIKAAAAGKLADPADALRLLDLDSFEVGADGDVDADEIADAITELLTNKPYLGTATAPRFQGSGDGGARKASGPSQLSKADLAGMSAEAIVQAKAEGRLKNLMTGE